MKVVTVADFEAEVLNSDKPVVVDFYADWCPPCKALTPILDKLSAERTDVKIVKVDVDASGELAAKYGIQAMPTLLMFRDGDVIAKKVGGGTRAMMVKWIDESLAIPAGTTLSKPSLSDADKKRLTKAFMDAVNADPSADKPIPGLKQKMPDGSAVTPRKALEFMLSSGQLFKQIEMAIEDGATVDIIIDQVKNGPKGPGR